MKPNRAKRKVITSRNTGKPLSLDQARTHKKRTHNKKMIRKEYKIPKSQICTQYIDLRAAGDINIVTKDKSIDVSFKW